MAEVEEFEMTGLEWMDESDPTPQQREQAHAARMGELMPMGGDGNTFVIGDVLVSLDGNSKQAQLGTIPYSESAYSGEPVMVVMAIEPNPEASPWGIEYTTDQKNVEAGEAEPEEEALVLAETVEEAIALLQSLFPNAIPTQTRLLPSLSLD